MTYRIYLGGDVYYGKADTLPDAVAMVLQLLMEGDVSEVRILVEGA